jgi:predicted PurR-regulated permease PerM
MTKDPTAFEIVWRSPWVRAFVYVTALIFLAVVLWRYRGAYAFALQIAIIGFLIAYILNPLVQLLGRARVGRALAVVLIYVVVLVFLMFGSILVTQVIVEIDRLVRLIPTAISNIAPFLESSYGSLSGWRENLPDFLRDRLGVEPAEDQTFAVLEDRITLFLQEQARIISLGVQDFVANAGSYLLIGVTGIISVTFQIMMILLTSAYFLYDFPKITANFRRYVPARWRPLYADLIIKTDWTVSGYLRGRLLTTLLLGIFIWIGLVIIGVPLALAISFFAAILNLVPYLGPIVGSIPAVLLGFTVSPLTALLAAVVFIIANQIEANVLGPLVLSKSINLHPVTVLISLLVGGGLLGLTGLLLAVPVVALAKVILEDYLLKRPAFQDSPLEPPPSPPSGPPSGVVPEPLPSKR